MAFPRPDEDLGKLILRVGIGAMFVGHGWPKLSGGPEKWQKLGGAMSNLGIDFMPTFWGFMAAFSEVVGGLAFALGLAFVPACLLLFTTMLVAAIMHLSKGDGIMGSSHAIESAVVFVSAIFMGPGRLRLRLPIIDR